MPARLCPKPWSAAPPTSRRTATRRPPPRRCRGPRSPSPPASPTSCRTGELEEKGYRVLVDCLKIAVDYPNTSYVSTRAFVSKNPDIVKRFIMGISDGIHAFKTHREEALKSAAGFLKSKQGPALDAAYDSFTKYVYPDIPRPSLKGIALVLAELKTKVPAAGGSKPEQLTYTAPFD